MTAVANEGTVYQYTLLNRLEDSDGNVLQTFEPQVRNQIDVLDTEEWNAIHSGMRMVVENTKEFDGFPIEAAGKTGTAQQNLKRPNHALFVGYAPYDDPEISIVLEFLGGEEPAHQWITLALERGKTVVTANKVAFALHWHELQKAAKQSGAGLYYEAAVCGACLLYTSDAADE